MCWWGPTTAPWWPILTGRAKFGLLSLENLWLWALKHLLSLKAPGLENMVADLMSRGGPLPDEWRLNPEVVKQI